MTLLRTWTLRERLENWPPFLVLALAVVKMKPLTREQKRIMHWNRSARRLKMLLIRHGVQIPRRPAWRRITLGELEKKCGLSPRLIRALSTREAWDGIRIENCFAFMEGCSFDPMKIHRKTQLMKSQINSGKALSHLTTQQAQKFAKAVQKWKTSK